MKRIPLITFIAIFSIVLSGCGADNQTDKKADPAPTESTQPEENSMDDQSSEGSLGGPDTDFKTEGVSEWDQNQEKRNNEELKKVSSAGWYNQDSKTGISRIHPTIKGRVTTNEDGSFAQFNGTLSITRDSYSHIKNDMGFTGNGIKDYAEAVAGIYKADGEAFTGPDKFNGLAGLEGYKFEYNYDNKRYVIVVAQSKSGKDFFSATLASNKKEVITSGMKELGLITNKELEKLSIASG